MNNIRLLPALLVFSEVARLQSFTAAANQLNMSKSAVSQQIKRLEDYCGQTLLTRNTRGMALTNAGEKLLARSVHLQDQVNLALDTLHASKDVPSGPFAVTMPHSLEPTIVMPALQQLCQEFPDLEPRIVVTDDPLDLIHEKLDVAIYFGDLKDSGYRALPIGTAEEVLAACPFYAQTLQEEVTPDNLHTLRLVATPWQHKSLQLNNHDNHQQQVINVNFTAHSNTFASSLSMVTFGIGAAMLPSFVVNKLITSGRLVRLMREYTGQHWPLHFVHRFDTPKPVHVDRFYQLILHFFDLANR